MSKIKVRVHKAFFINDKDKEEYYFINILNKRCNTHVTIISVTGFKPALLSIEPTERLLPVNIPPRSEWETWVKVSELGNDAYNRIIVTTVDNKRFYSKKRMRVPQSGNIPGSK